MTPHARNSTEAVVITLTNSWSKFPLFAIQLIDDTHYKFLRISRQKKISIVFCLKCGNPFCTGPWLADILHCLSGDIYNTWQKLICGSKFKKVYRYCVAQRVYALLLQKLQKKTEISVLTILWRKIYLHLTDSCEPMSCRFLLFGSGATCVPQHQPAKMAIDKSPDLNGTYQKIQVFCSFRNYSRITPSTSWWSCYKTERGYQFHIWPSISMIFPT